MTDEKIMKTEMQQHSPVPQRVAYINFVDTLDDKKSKTLMIVCAEIINKEHPDILYLLFSSPGGSVDYGITLYTYLRALPCMVITHNTGSIESIAIIPFLAGEVRLAAPQSRFLLHGVFWQPPGGQTIPTKQVDELVSRFRGDEDRIREILLDRTKLNKEQIDRFFLSGESKTAEFAQEVGIISEIKLPKIQRGSSLFSCNFA